ncbi:MAG: sigma-70 family RNA polymerase sigma factor [Planctomycetota bacterium]
MLSTDNPLDRGDIRLTHWLEDIYRDHRRGLFGLALSVVREAATAEDAVHEAFARLARQKGPPDGDAAAYVYKAVRNAAIDQARRRKARPTPTDDPASLFETSKENNPGHAAETNETHAMLMRAIDNLPDDEREAVVMRSFGGLTYQQIAEATGRPLTTVSSQYQRALSKLKQQLEGAHVNA